MNFLELGLKQNIVDILTKLGYVTPTEIQQKAIPVILNKQDVVGRSETGSGKTFAFGLPIVQNIEWQNESLQAIVICPTRELAMQDADEIKKVASELSIGVCAVFGGSNMARQIDALKRKPKIVVGTPGRIKDLINKKVLKLENIKVAVLDEADEMLDMGFRTDIEDILSHTPKTRQTVLFSATIPDEIKEIITKHLSPNSVMIEVGTENKSPITIEQKYVFVDKKHKNDALQQLFLSDIFGKTIVFVNTKRYAENLEKFLRKANIECRAIHGDLRQNDRRKVLLAFKAGKCDILIATDVAARGLDIKDVKCIVNFDLPQQMEFYVHRIGRTARAGESGKVLNLITSLAELSYMREIEKITKAKIEQFESQNENLKPYLVDTKTLAKETSRFSSKDEHKSHSRFGGQTRRSGKSNFGHNRSNGDHFGERHSRDGHSFAGKKRFGKNESEDNNTFGSKDVERKRYTSHRTHTDYSANRNGDDNTQSSQDGETKRSYNTGRSRFGRSRFSENRFGKRQFTHNGGHRDFAKKDWHRNDTDRQTNDDTDKSNDKSGDDFKQKSNYRRSEYGSKSHYSHNGSNRDGRSSHFSKKWDDRRHNDSNDFGEKKFGEKKFGDDTDGKKSFGKKSYGKRDFHNSSSKKSFRGSRSSTSKSSGGDHKWYNKFSKNK